MKSAIYPGSFDPITKGHLNIIKRAAIVFEKLTVCVMVNAEKTPMFSLEERVDFVRRVTENLPNVTVDTYSGMLANYAAEHDNAVVIKGLRAMSDFEKEYQMALINFKVNPRLDTIFFPADENYMYLSSSAVKQLAQFGALLDEFVPREIIPDIQKKFSERNGHTNG